MRQSLSQYPHLEFRREAISARAKQTKSILGGLSLLATHPDGEHRLYQDESTNEYWQLASAWNWGAKPYCFLVPDIETEEWLKERYVDPDELLVYAASMEQFLSQPAIGEIADLPKHIRSLQQVRLLAREPEGRWFGPYDRKNIIPI